MAASDWKTRKYGDIPQSFVNTAKSIVIKNGTTKVEGTDVFYQEAYPHADRKCAIQVLFLHGASFKSDTWKDLGTLAMTAAQGARCVAIDLPGFGRTSGSANFNKTALFIHGVINKLDLKNIVIVSPSMSGGFSLPFLIGPLVDQDGGGDVKRSRDLVKGFVPVAPVNTGAYQNELYEACRIPTLIVYGDRDKNLGQQSLAKLKYLPNSREEMFADAGHACYMNQPAHWHRVLTGFLGDINDMISS